MSCRPMTPYACACVYVLRWETAALVVSIGASQGEPMQVSLARACVVQPYCRSVMQQHDNGWYGNNISQWRNECRPINFQHASMCVSMKNEIFLIPIFLL